MTVPSTSDGRQVRPAIPADSRNAPDAVIVSPAATAAPTAVLQAVVFFGGFASIGSELAISRLIAPYFGASTFIWATIIGLNLTFLSLGYWWGGRVADRRPSARVLFGITAVAAVAIALLPLLARPILGTSLAAFQNLDVGAFYGALVGTLLLMALPLTLLGFVTPFAIRLRLHDVRAAGNTAGSVYALSTVGSIAGSFVPVLLLIPNLGAARTFVALGLALLIPSVIGLFSVRAFTPGALAVLAVALLPFMAVAQPAGVRPPEGGTLLTERESTYNYIQVVQENGRNLLILNDGHAIHSIYDPANLLTGGPWDYFMAAPLVVDGASPDSVRQAMFIGLAGGTAARQLTAAYGPIPIDGVEIDPDIVNVAREYFGLDELPNVRAIVADGRYALKTSSAHYDLIGVDAYRQPYIPFQLTSAEFFDEVADRLTPNGVAVVNVGRTQTDYRLVDAISSTMAHVFDHVYAVDVDSYMNTIVIGTNAPSSIANIAANAERFPPESPVRTVAGWIAADGSPRRVEPGSIVFTDDKAPVEQVIDQIILDAAREVTGQ
ncbi:MAG: fused MFS/spermidine synthase [Thermomicrobiales bacterium]|nr:fused MFS/spermidine synthase [Thermomicrobiales bacterium]